MKLLIMGLILLNVLGATAQTSFPNDDKYRRNLLFPAQDSYCPRLEGNYPANCCPYKEKQGIQCYYFNTTSVSVGSYGSGTGCVNGADTQVTCCNRTAVTCIEDLSDKRFIPRLIKRNYQAADVCKFEACPFPKYWKNDNIKGKEISDVRPQTVLCTAALQADQCASTGLPECSALSTCPVPQPAPNPSPTPTPSPGPAPGPAPGPSPGPAPGPEPAPNPGPSPAPTPTPTPTPTPPPAPVPVDPGIG